MLEPLECPLLPGSIVYMTGVVDLKEIYIRKVEDHNESHEKFLDLVDEFCSKGKYKLNKLLLKYKLIVKYMFQRYQLIGL